MASALEQEARPGLRRRDHSTSENKSMFFITISKQLLFQLKYSLSNSSMVKTGLKALAAAVKPRKKAVANAPEESKRRKSFTSIIVSAGANHFVASRTSKSKASEVWETYKKKKREVISDTASAVSKAGSLNSGQLLICSPTLWCLPVWVVATSAVKKLLSKKRKASETSSLESNKESAPVSSELSANMARDIALTFIAAKNNYFQMALQSLRKKAKVSDESVAKGELEYFTA